MGVDGAFQAWEAWGMGMKEGSGVRPDFQTLAFHDFPIPALL